MINKDIVTLQTTIKRRWGTASSPKVQRYVGNCAALGLTFLAEPGTFVEEEEVAITAVTDLDTLQAYLNSVTLDDLVKQMRAKGITQKAFCAAVGMST